MFSLSNRAMITTMVFTKNSGNTGGEMSTKANRSLLNTIFSDGFSEDLSDPAVLRTKLSVEMKLESLNAPFIWLKDAPASNEVNLRGRKAAFRNHVYAWEGHLRPFVSKIMEAYYSIMKGNRLVAVKCLTLAEKLVRRGEEVGDQKLTRHSAAIKYLFSSTIAFVFYRCNLFTEALKFLEAVGPNATMSADTRISLIFMRALTLFYWGRPTYVSALKFAAIGLTKKPTDVELRFLYMQLMYELWDTQMDPKFFRMAASHLSFMPKDSLGTLTSFDQIYRARTEPNNNSIAVCYMEKILGQLSSQTTYGKMQHIELSILNQLETDPYFSSFLKQTANFFFFDNQPEKAHFLYGIAKKFCFECAYHWLDLSMLLYPEECNEELYKSVLSYHGSGYFAKFLKRISLHTLLTDPVEAYRYACQALFVESNCNAERAENPAYDVHVLDEKIKVFGQFTNLGFYEFMVYFAHATAQDVAAKNFLTLIQPLLSNYVTAIECRPEAQTVFSILSTNEYYRFPLRIHKHGLVDSWVVHSYDF